MAQYIDKSALVAELKKRISNYWSNSENTMGIYPYALEEVIKYVDSLEVKEKDLEKEVTLWANAIPEIRLDDVQRLAKHFFELGLKAQKGE